MLLRENTERYFSACLLSSAGSSSPLSFLVMSFDTRRQSGKDTNTDTILFLWSGTAGKKDLRQERLFSLNTKRALLPMTISMKNRVQQKQKDWMRMRMRVLAMKLGRTNARLSSLLSIRRESMASKTTEIIDQAKDMMGMIVPNPLGRQLSNWSQTSFSASTTLKKHCAIVSKAALYLPKSVHREQGQTPTYHGAERTFVRQNQAMKTTDKGLPVTPFNIFTCFHRKWNIFYIEIVLCKMYVVLLYKMCYNRLLKRQI